MNIKYIDTGTLYEGFNGLGGTTINNSTRLCNKNGITYIEFTPFDKFDWVKLHFSTRLGGVSEGIYSSMNFSFDRGDDNENVYKDYELFLDTMNIKPENCVCTKQTHTTNVIAVDYNMAGMGLTRARNFDNVDGLVTNEPGLCLITYFADCVPVYFIDPVKIDNIVISLTVIPPFVYLEFPLPRIIAGAFTLAYSLANFTITSSGIPVISSAHFGVYCFKVFLNSWYPIDLSNKNSSS